MVNNNHDEEIKEEGEETEMQGEEANKGAETENEKEGKNHEISMEDLIEDEEDEQEGSRKVEGNADEEEKSTWNEAKRLPSLIEERKMIALALQNVVTLLLQNHIYQNAGKYYHQKQDGIIGLDLMRAVCRIVVMEFMEKYEAKNKEILENSDEALKINIEADIFMFFVDDSLEMRELQDLTKKAGKLK